MLASKDSCRFTSCKWLCPLLCGKVCLTLLSS